MFLNVYYCQKKAWSTLVSINHQDGSEKGMKGVLWQRNFVKFCTVLKIVGQM